MIKPGKRHPVTLSPRHFVRKKERRMSKQAWRYDHLTWPEMKAAIARDPQPVVAIPIGAVEDHGAHTAALDRQRHSRGRAGRVRAARGGRPAGAAGHPVWAGRAPHGFPRRDRDRYRDHAGLPGADRDLGGAARLHAYPDRQRPWLEPSICDLAARKCVLATGVICAATTSQRGCRPCADRRRAGGGASRRPWLGRPRLRVRDRDDAAPAP